MEKFECPFCKGEGHIQITSMPKTDKELAIKNMDKVVLGAAIVSLRQRGMTYREIGDLMGLDHPQKVKHYEQYGKIK